MTFVTSPRHRIAQELSLQARYRGKDRNACFIVSYNEAVIILFPRGGGGGGANADGGPIIPVIILIGALTSTIIISVEIQHAGEKERKNAEQFQPRSPTVLSFRYV